MDKQIKHINGKLFAIMISLFMIVTLVVPIGTHASAQENTNGKNIIEAFSIQMAKGASVQADGKYVWNASSTYPNHRFVYRINFALSGIGDIAPGDIQITIPKTILKDRNGNDADTVELSVPTEEEAEKAEADGDSTKINEYTWKESDDGQNIIIYNRVKRPSGEQGSIEVAFSTTETTYEYVDMGGSEPFNAHLEVKNDGNVARADSENIPVYINTTAEIQSTTKDFPGNKPQIIRQWDPSWGVQPENTKGKYFLVWEIVTKIKGTQTQPFTLQLDDTPATQGVQVVGYRMSSGEYSTKNTLENLRVAPSSEMKVTNYVLTSYDPAQYANMDSYDIKNNIKATVIPVDGVDAPTSATSTKTFTWENPKFTPVIGSYKGRKYGNSNWFEKFNAYWDYASYDLDQLQDGKVKSLDKFKYYIELLSYPYPKTLDGDPNDPNSYGKKKVNYELTDDTLYLNDDLKVPQDNGLDEKITLPDNARKLTKDDYRYLSAHWGIQYEIRQFNQETQSFEIDPNAKPSQNDIVHFFAKIDNQWVEVALYNMGSHAPTIVRKDIVDSLDQGKIIFKDDSLVTGLRMTTSNAYYSTKLYAYPMISLKNSDYVMKQIKDKDMVKLHNFADMKITDEKGEEIYNVTKYAFDRAVRPKKASSLVKHVVSTGNDTAKKAFVLRWRISQQEIIKTDSKQDYLVQDSGRFYDLLPKGTHLQKGSVAIQTEKGYLSKNSFTYKIIENYMQSGRDLITVDIPVQAKYYNLYLNAVMDWDAIKDYGTDIINPVAYETGNDTITNGHPDDGGYLTGENKAFMMNLDEKTDAKKFLYDQEPFEIDSLTSAIAGLKKQVKDSRDQQYAYDTTTSRNGTYAYQLRYENTYTTKAKHLIFFDSLENYEGDGKKSDWHGTLQSLDLSQLTDQGIAPTVYFSTKDHLVLENNHDLTNTNIWQVLDKNTDLSTVKAIAIDCSKKADGSEFILPEGGSLNAYIYMQAPDDVTGDTGRYLSAYNNVYLKDTLVDTNNNEQTYFIHQDYTKVTLRITADIQIHKQSTEDENQSIEGAKYSLTGTSDYGTKVNITEETGKNGLATFEEIEKGTYTLKEASSPSDWLLDKTEYQVVIDGKGHVTVQKQNTTTNLNKKNDAFILKDAPRIHGDLKFLKKDFVDKTKGIEGAKFRIEGTSAYGNDILLYASSNDYGVVEFKDIEYGIYHLKEVGTPDNYIPNEKEYTVIVDDKGNVGIENSTMDKQGNVIIYNEPYHTIQVSKQSSYDDSLLPGATFSLKGSSNDGTSVNMTATSQDNGLVTFNKLKAGNYILQETSAPAGYNLDTNKYTVVLKNDGTYTINGLEKNDSGYYRINNEKQKDGKIIVKKFWKDNKTNNNRPTPVIHITTNINKVPSYVMWREDKTRDANVGPGNSAFFTLASSNELANTITKVVEETDASKVPADAIRLDRDFDNPNALYKIYGWKDGAELHYYTNAQSIRMTDTSIKMFTSMMNVTSIDLAKFETSKVTNMATAFQFCSSLENLDLSHFNTSNVVNMGYMFYNCKNLKNLNLSNFNTSQVISMNSMFDSCNNLTNLDISSFNTSKVATMSSLFYHCFNLTSLNVSHFDTSNVEYMNNMFDTCQKLTELDVSHFNTSKVKNMYAMFSHCTNLTSLDLSHFDTINVEKMANMFNGCSNLTLLKLSNFNTSKVTSMNSMFQDCKKLVDLDVSQFDTSKVMDMEYMFFNCNNLKALNLKHFNTSKVTDMQDMFAYCKNLENLDLSSFNTSLVEDMSSMFFICENLKTLDISSFDTSSVKSMASMFSACKQLESLDLTHFQTPKLNDMTRMFNNCSKLTTLKLDNMDTSRVKNMSLLFHGCSSLVSLDLSHFNTSAVTDMSNMFSNCTNMKNLNIGSFDTSNVTTMSYMFASDTSLENIDLSSFNTSNVTSMVYMFNNCQKLRNIYVSDRWDTSNAKYNYGMFTGATLLPNYKLGLDDKTRAYYGGDGNGYLIYKAYSAPSLASSLVSTVRSIGHAAMNLLEKLQLVTVVHAEDGTYSSDTDATITKDGDEWTYEFNVADDQATYYAWEEDLDGYVSTAYANAPAETTKAQPAQITNTANNYSEPKTYGFTLTKSVDSKKTVDKVVPDVRYAHTPNVDDKGNQITNYGNNLNTNEIVTIPGASKLKVQITYGGEASSYDWLCMWQGSHPDYSASKNSNSSLISKIGGGYHLNASNTKQYDVDGDSVTFSFRSDTSGYGDGYGYYATVTGYDAEGNIVTKTIKTVTDETSGEVPQEYKDKTYLFTITLNGSKISGTQVFGDTVFQDGEAKVSLKPGESLQFNNIPELTSYHVKEDEYKGFVATSENDTGTLNASNTNPTVSFVNHYQEETFVPQKTNGFTLRKAVDGFHQNDDTAYKFHLIFKNLAPSTTYGYGKTSFTSHEDGYADLALDLKKDESVQFDSLPVGTLYKISEEAGDYRPSYKIENKATVGHIAQSADSNDDINRPLSTSWETVDDQEQITITFTNTVNKYQNLILKKETTGGKTNEKFTFNVHFSNVPSVGFMSDAGKVIPNDEGEADVTVLLSAGEAMTFENIPVTTKYQIVEKANIGKASYAISSSQNGQFVHDHGDNQVANKDLSTDEETVDEGEDATVTFTNDIPDLTDITLKKKVTGIFGDRNQYFKFHFTLNNAPQSTKLSVDLSHASENAEGHKNPLFISQDAQGVIQADIYLKHGEEVVIRNVPKSATYSLIETVEGYQVSHQINNEAPIASKDINNQPVAQDTVVYINDASGSLPVGLWRSQILIEVFVGILIIIALIIIFLSYKRYRLH